jgi:hypothetical protein
MIPIQGRISMVMIPMLHGDDPNATSKLNSTSQNTPIKKFNVVFHHLIKVLELFFDLYYLS